MKQTILRVNLTLTLFCIHVKVLYGSRSRSKIWVEETEPRLLQKQVAAFPGKVFCWKQNKWPFTAQHSRSNNNWQSQCSCSFANFAQKAMASHGAAHTARLTVRRERPAQLFKYWLSSTSREPDASSAEAAFSLRRRSRSAAAATSLPLPGFLTSIGKSAILYTPWK